MERYFEKIGTDIIEINHERAMQCETFGMLYEDTNHILLHNRNGLLLRNGYIVDCMCCGELNLHAMENCSSDHYELMSVIYESLDDYLHKVIDSPDIVDQLPYIKYNGEVFKENYRFKGGRVKAILQHEGSGEPWFVLEKYKILLFCPLDETRFERYHELRRNPYFYVTIFGGRDFFDVKLLIEKVDYILAPIKDKFTIVIVSGKADGADTLGEIYAQLRGYDLECEPADWDRFGKSAGFKRNTVMADKSQGAIGFWDGFSKGTKHMIDICKAKKLQLAVISYKSSQKQRWVYICRNCGHVSYNSFYISAKVFSETCKDCNKPDIFTAKLSTL